MVLEFWECCLKESRLRFQESSFALSQGKALAIQAGAPAAILDHEAMGPGGGKLFQAWLHTTPGQPPSKFT